MKNGETFNLKLFKGLLCNLGSLYFKSYDCCIWPDNLSCAFPAIIWRPETPQVFDSWLRVVNFYQATWNLSDNPALQEIWTNLQMPARKYSV